MMKKHFFLTTFLVAVISLTSIAAVFASSTESAKKYFTVYDIDYYNQSWLLTSLGGLQARTVIMRDDVIGNLPAGYMGVYPRLYDDDDFLVSAPAGWVYNNTPAGGIDIPAPTYNETGAYYSYGLTKAYNGDGYIQYSTPSLNIK